MARMRGGFKHDPNHGRAGYLGVRHRPRVPALRLLLAGAKGRSASREVCQRQLRSGLGGGAERER